MTFPGNPLPFSRRLGCLILHVVALVSVCVAALPFAVGSAWAQFRAQAYVSGLASPVGFEQDPADPTVQFVVEQRGVIRVIRNGVLEPTPFLDISGSALFSGEQGLLGLAFPPDTATSRRFYVQFSNPSGATVIARFKRNALNPLVADAASRFDLVWSPGQASIPQPFGNHKGGQLAFGPDGYLYMGLGDGGSGNDPGHRAQDPNSLLGKMLRLDVSVPDTDPKGYAVPADNPFVDGSPIAALGEIWAFGVRNPWRFSFDKPALGGTGALVIADVGQSAWEEINYEPANRGGRNYGWRNREGAHPNVTSLPVAYGPTTDPIFEYSHAEGVSVTGGFVYRGTALGPAPQGRYFFADLTGRVWSLGLSINPGTGEASATDRLEHTAALAAGAPLGLISSFGQDAQGELYIVSYTLGRVLRIVGSSGPPGPEPDFTGDGRADLAIHDRQTGDWYLGVSTGTGFRIEAWVNGFGNRGEDVEQVLVGDFTGDGKTDAAVHDRQSGDWYVGVSTGTGFRIERWGVHFGTRGDAVEHVLAGDFTGDGRADVAIHDRLTGDWYVGVSTGTGFRIEPWANRFGNRGNVVEEVLVGDFTGDGKADVAIHDKQTGDWFVGVSTGTGFRIEHWAGGFGNRGDAVERVLTGDFTGDGKADVAIHDTQTGDWFVGVSTGTGFRIEHWGTGFGNRGEQVEEVLVGDFTGDGKADVVIHDTQTGDWFVGVSTGTGFRIEHWSSRFGNRGGDVEEAFVGDYTGDGKADVAIHNTRTGEWYVGVSTGTGFRIEPWGDRFGNRGEGVESTFGGRRAIGDLTD
jgi:glucose/arabinose dehydrogenase/phenylpyruvate tautomerase PptA (4-oxalocrotonate tautomerase family)